MLFSERFLTLYEFLLKRYTEEEYEVMLGKNIITSCLIEGVVLEDSEEI